MAFGESLPGLLNDIEEEHWEKSPCFSLAKPLYRSSWSGFQGPIAPFKVFRVLLSVGGEKHSWLSFTDFPVQTGASRSLGQKAEDSNHVLSDDSQYWKLFVFLKNFFFLKNTTWASSIKFTPIDTTSLLLFFQSTVESNQQAGISFQATQLTSSGFVLLGIPKTWEILWLQIGRMPWTQKAAASWSSSPAP